MFLPGLSTLSTCSMASQGSGRSRNTASAVPSATLGKPPLLDAVFGPVLTGAVDGAVAVEGMGSVGAALLELASEDSVFPHTSLWVTVTRCPKPSLKRRGKSCK